MKKSIVQKGGGGGGDVSNRLNEIRHGQENLNKDFCIY